VAPDIGNEPHDLANQLVDIRNALLPFETGQPRNGIGLPDILDRTPEIGHEAADVAERPVETERQSPQ